jgi:transcriptional regulator with XRE-family HTH domain
MAVGTTDIEKHDWQRNGLVPPRRLGTLLSRARSANGLTLDDIVQRSDGAFSMSTLASVERGTTYVTESELRWLAELYGIETSQLVPSRSQLVIDLDDGVLGVQSHRRVKINKDAGRQEVLTRYLAMVYAMREIEPGTYITLRVDDLDVLGSALHLRPADAAADLHALMADPSDLVSNRFAMLQRKLLVPAAGVLVALIAAGSLVLVENRASAADSVKSPVSVGTAVVQQRNPDGTPGAIEVRD